MSVLAGVSPALTQVGAGLDVSAPTWIGLDAVRAAVAEIEQARAPVPGAQVSVEHSGTGMGWAEGRTCLLRVGPGVVGLRTLDVRAAEQTRRRQDERPRPALEGLDLEAERVPQRQVREWSARSRSRMVEAVAGLDLTPIMQAPGSLGMITFSLPWCWDVITPTGAHFKRLIATLRRRAERAGLAWIGLWKLELQRRGAPHLHVLMRLPATLAGMRAEEWMHRQWADVVRAAFYEQVTDVLERAVYDLRYDDHVRHGVHWSPAARYDDPRRVTVYFSGHSAKHDQGKEYQHQVPDLWQAPGAGPGRFWGVWGMSSAVREVELTEEETVEVARILRKVTRARDRRIEASKRAIGKDPLVRVRPVRRTWQWQEISGPLDVGHAVPDDHGRWWTMVEVEVQRSRWVRRRRRRRNLGAGGRGPGGFVVINDGPALALAIAAVLRQRRHPLGVTTGGVSDRRSPQRPEQVAGDQARHGPGRVLGFDVTGPVDGVHGRPAGLDLGVSQFEGLGAGQPVPR